MYGAFCWTALGLGSHCLAETFVHAGRQMDMSAFRGFELRAAHQALSAELPVPLKAGRRRRQPHPSGGLCTDMNGKSFRWNWPNVPFAAVCNDDDGKDAKPSVDSLTNIP